MKKILYLFLISVIFIAGCGKKEETKKEIVEKIKYVKTALITKRSMNQVFSSDAVLQPKKKIDYKTEKGGTIKEIFKRNGDIVKTGDVVMQLTDPATEGIYSAAKTNYDISNETHQKFKKLYEKKLISYLEYAPYENSFASASGNFESAKADYEKLLGKASIDGIVGNLFLKEGNKIEKENVLFTIVDDTQMESYVGFPAEWLNEIKIGQELEITISALNEVFSGKITEINPIADSVTKKFMVKISVENPDGKIKDGMYAIVKIPVGSRDVFSIEDTGIFIRDLISYIYMVQEGKAHRITVKTGASNLPYTEILYDNIKDGDRIIIDGIYGLEEGDIVEEVK
ncbi:MAG: efflux RND transporter periplasmic adaptor subunit [Fusobacteriaceae bacterium]|nr:efflux RND transporter periplasmic adaptor subunit [Fusobacteriaceae bacterium]